MMIPTSRPSSEAEASLLGVTVGVPAEAVDAVPPVGVLRDEVVVNAAPD